MNEKIMRILTGIKIIFVYLFTFVGLIMTLLIIVVLWPVVKVLSMVKTKSEQIHVIENYILSSQYKKGASEKEDRHKIKRVIRHYSGHTYNSYSINNNKTRYILLIHGNATTAMATWFNIMPYLDKSTNSDFNIHAIDMPGFGGESSEFYEFCKFANDDMIVNYCRDYIINYIRHLKNMCDYKGQFEIILIGHSFGSYLVSHVANIYNVNRVVLIAPVGIFGDVARKFDILSPLMRVRRLVAFIMGFYYETKFVFSFGLSSVWNKYYAVLMRSPMSLVVSYFMCQKIMDPQWSRPCIDIITNLKCRLSIVLCDNDIFVGHKRVIHLALEYKMTHNLVKGNHSAVLEEPAMIAEVLKSAISHAVVPKNNQVYVE